MENKKNEFMKWILEQREYIEMEYKGKTFRFLTELPLAFTLLNAENVLVESQDMQTMSVDQLPKNVLTSLICELSVPNDDGFGKLTPDNIGFLPSSFMQPLKGVLKAALSGLHDMAEKKSLNPKQPRSEI